MNTKTSPVMVVGKTTNEELSLLTKFFRNQNILGKKEKILCVGADISPQSVSQRRSQEKVQFVLFSNIKTDMLIRYDIAMQAKKFPLDVFSMFAFNVKGERPHKTGITCCSALSSIMVLIQSKLSIPLSRNEVAA